MKMQIPGNFDVVQNVRPNIFDYATSELSQDAVLSWLIGWADKSCIHINRQLHCAGQYFVNALMKNSGLNRGKINKVIVKRQFFSVDILVEVDNDVVILIEDKIFTSEHGEQLKKYKSSIKDNYRDRTIVPVYLKTGEQSDYSAVYAAGYTVFKRKDLLEVLEAGVAFGVENDIYEDFLQHIRALQRDVESWRSEPPTSWKSLAWQGFYGALQEEMVDLGFGYVPNQSGGFIGAWWYRGVRWGSSGVYLQFEQDKLCFKINVGDKQTAERALLRDSWRSLLLGSGPIKRLPKHSHF